MSEGPLPISPAPAADARWARLLAAGRPRGGLRHLAGDADGLLELASLLTDPLSGPRLLDLWGHSAPGANTLLALAAWGPDLLLYSLDLGGGARYPSLGHLLPAAHWLEREIALSSLSPEPMPAPVPLEVAGGTPVEPLLDARGIGVFTIPFGPIRSGVVESILYDVATAGEDMLRVAVRGGFKHRGLERRLTEVPIDQISLVGERVAGVFSVSGALAICQAVEAAASVEVSAEAAGVRGVLAELERLYNHCDSILKLTEDASLAVAMAQMGILKERVLRLLAEISGHRYGRGVVTLGGVTAGVSPKHLRDVLRRWRADARQVRHLLLATNSFLDRLQRTGRISREDVAALGGSGPLARASQLPWDARHERPQGIYRKLLVKPAVMSDCDAMARFEVRLEEMRESVDLIERITEEVDLAAPGPVVPVRLEAGAVGFSSAEAAEGEWTVVVEAAAGNRLASCRIRPASLLNFACFPRACEGWVLTDFAFIEHSFGLSVAGRDR